MDAFGLSTSRSNVACTSIEDLQGHLHQLLATKTSATRAEHIAPSFELLSHTPIHLPAELENSAAPDGTVGDAQSQPAPAPARMVLASETVQNQSADDPTLQKAVVKHITNAIGAVDGSAWIVRQVTRDAQGWQFTYICRDSLQAWTRANAKNPDRPAIAMYSGFLGQDPINYSRPAFDCRGTLSIAFSKSSRAIVVKYEHTPLHKTVAQLVERLPPRQIPVPTPHGNSTSLRTPKPKRPRQVDGEESTGKKRTPKAKPPLAEGADSSRKKRTPKPKHPRPDEGENEGGGEGNEGSKRKRRKTAKAAKAPEAQMGQLIDDQNTPQTQTPSNGAVDKPGFPGFLNVPPAEAERRRQTATELLTGRGIDPATLSSEQFNIFANQAPNLQTASLDMLAKYGAERLRIVHPDEKEQTASSQSTPATNTSPATAPLPPSENTSTPTKGAKGKKRKSGRPLTEVSIGNGAVVPMEQDGGLGTTESSLKPKSGKKPRPTRGRCDTCKTRGVQCTKEHPSCSVCIGAGIECVYLPPRPRRKSEKQVEPAQQEQEDSHLSEDPSDGRQEADNEDAGLALVPDLPAQHTVAPPQVPPHDMENDEFIPDPNILSAPVEQQTTATQPTSTHNYYEHQQHGLDFPQIPHAQAQAEPAQVSSFTYPQAHNNQDGTQPPPAMAFPPEPAQPPQTVAAPDHYSASARHQQAQPDPSAGRKTLPTTQSKQTPVPPPVIIPTHASNWTTSPSVPHATTASPKVASQQPAKRSKPRQPKPDTERQRHDSTERATAQSNQYQSPMTRSPYQSAAQVNSRQSRRSQTRTPVAPNSQPPPQPSTTPVPQPATAPPYNPPTVSGSVPSYDAYPRYSANNSSHIGSNGNEQYTDAGTGHSSSRATYGSDSYQSHVTTAPPSYSSTPSYDYGRASGSSNPLSQALNATTAYSGASSSTSNPWSTSQARAPQNNNSSSTYPQPAPNTSASHGYSTRASDSRNLNQNTPYSQPQSQSYNSYAAQQPGLNQQGQQNWYGFNANNNSNQGNFANNRQGGHGNHRSGVAGGYSGHYGGNDEQTMYDLMRTGSSNR